MTSSRPSTNSPLIQASSLALAATTLLSLGGCWAGGLSEGGDHISNDKFVYSSDSYSPKTITLLDTRTKQPVWTGDIPVGQQMLVKFRTGRKSTQGDSMPDTMLWGLTPVGAYTAHNLNSIPCPPAAARRLEMSIRPTPEMPSANAGDLIPAPPYGGDMPTPPNRSIGPGTKSTAPTAPAPAAAPATPAAPVAPVAPAAPAAPKPATPPSGNDMKPPVVDLPEAPAKDAAPAAPKTPVPATAPAPAAAAAPAPAPATPPAEPSK